MKITYHGTVYLVAFTSCYADRSNGNARCLLCQVYYSEPEIWIEKPRWKLHARSHFRRGELPERTKSSNGSGGTTTYISERL